MLMICVIQQGTVHNVVTYDMCNWTNNNSQFVNQQGKIHSFMTYYMSNPIRYNSQFFDLWRVQFDKVEFIVFLFVICVNLQGTIHNFVTYDGCNPTR